MHLGDKKKKSEQKGKSLSQLLNEVDLDDESLFTFSDEELDNMISELQTSSTARSPEEIDKMNATKFKSAVSSMQFASLSSDKAVLSSDEVKETDKIDEGISDEMIKSAMKSSIVFAFVHGNVTTKKSLDQNLKIFYQIKLFSKNNSFDQIHFFRIRTKKMHLGDKKKKSEQKGKSLSQLLNEVDLDDESLFTFSDEELDNMISELQTSSTARSPEEIDKMNATKFKSAVSSMQFASLSSDKAVLSSDEVKETDKIDEGISDEMIKSAMKSSIVFAFVHGNVTTKKSLDQNLKIFYQIKLFSKNNSFDQIHFFRIRTKKMHLGDKKKKSEQKGKSLSQLLNEVDLDDESLFTFSDEELDNMISELQTSSTARSPEEIDKMNATKFKSAVSSMQFASLSSDKAVLSSDEVKETDKIDEGISDEMIKSAMKSSIVFAFVHGNVTTKKAWIRI